VTAIIQLLGTLYAVPLQTNEIVLANLELYSDKDGVNPITDATGVKIKSVLVDGWDVQYRIFPTTRTDYIKGERVTWKWNLSRIWGKTWYRDPDTNTIKSAWDSSAEFVGGDLNNL
jgi:hypothetical protein